MFLDVIICLWFSMCLCLGCHCLVMKLFREVVELFSACVLLGLEMGINHSSSCLMEVMCNVQRSMILLSFMVSSKQFFNALLKNFCFAHLQVASLNNYWFFSLNFIELSYGLFCGTVISFGYMPWVTFETSTLIFSKKGPLWLHTF